MIVAPASSNTLRVSGEVQLAWPNHCGSFLLRAHAEGAVSRFGARQVPKSEYCA